MSIAVFDFDTLNIPGAEGRAVAIRGTLLQIAALPGAHVPTSALADAFHLLSLPREEDTPPITARRVTCGQLAEAIGRTADPVSNHRDSGGHLARRWFRAQIDAWGKSEDPRLAAMAGTAARELAELTE